MKYRVHVNHQKVLSSIRSSFWHSLVVLGVFGTLAGAGFAKPVFAQVSESSSNQDESSELDLWRGASLGIRIGKEDGKVVVEQVHEHVANSCTLKKGDRLVEVGGVQVNVDELAKFGEFLAATVPDIELPAIVERDGELIEIEVPTFRRELLDVPRIVEQLQSNRIIKSYLKETDREDYLDTVLERMTKAVSESNSPREAAEGINSIIDEINVSHTAILPRQSYKQLTGGEAGDLGLTLQRYRIRGKNRYFVADRMPGSSGYESNIELGDEIVQLNGIQIEKSKRLILSGQEHRRRLFFLQVDVGEQIKLGVKRRQNSRITSTTLEARDSVPAEDVIGLSARVIESGNNRYGYMRFWNLMSMKSPRLMQNVIKEQFADCHMLILDLRGRGGLIPAVLAMDRAIEESEIPVVAITDDLTRSAKEMLSLLIKKHDHVTVVGQTTAGAVTGATMMDLPSGSGMMFPVVSPDALKRFTGDVILERVGVDPDIELDFQLPWCGGNDRLLQGAIETADDQIEEFLKNII